LEKILLSRHLLYFETKFIVIQNRENNLIFFLQSWFQYFK